MKFISVIIYLRQYFRQARSSLHAAGLDRVSTGWGRGHELRAEKWEPHWERVGSLLCPISSLCWWGQEGTRDWEVGGSWWFSRVQWESCYIFTPTSKTTDLCCANRHTHTARMPLANYPPATAFTVECHGLTHHCYEPIFDVSCSMCVSWERER